VCVRCDEKMANERGVKRVFFGLAMSRVGVFEMAELGTQQRKMSSYPRARGGERDAG
jgi:hypothetical protein